MLRNFLKNKTRKKMRSGEVKKRTKGEKAKRRKGEKAKRRAVEIRRAEQKRNALAKLKMPRIQNIKRTWKGNRQRKMTRKPKDAKVQKEDCVVLHAVPLTHIEKAIHLFVSACAPHLSRPELQGAVERDRANVVVALERRCVSLTYLSTCVTVSLVLLRSKGKGQHSRSKGQGVLPWYQ